ncbi:hypothetical protein P5V15_003715 [Pogonomyrmex californicus]
MSTLRKKADQRRMRKTRTDNLVGDVTIDDFANTLQIHLRLKKSATNVSNEVEQEATIQEEYQSEWDKMDDETLLNNNTRGRRHRRKSKNSQDNNEDEGINYPLDIWFIISEYIQPEEVGKFARICKSSYYVTTTGKFWFHLYKSYYKFVPNLPERLQPQCMRLHGLRACVIRALHYSYFRTPEGEIQNTAYLRQEDPHSLVKRRCTLMWHHKGKIRWYFYFKLKEVSKTCNRRQNEQCDSKKSEFLQTLEDVAVNPENGCKVLKVCCLKYNLVPPVTGLILQTVSTNLMPSFRQHRLQLRFGTLDIASTFTNEIILSDVIGYSILNWWDPAYPHQDTGYTIELPQRELWDI